LEKLTGTFGRVAERVAIVRDAAEYRKARADGKHGAWISIQGGNALDHDLDDFDRIPEGIIVRVTVVHLTNSSLGATSNPYGPRRANRGLTALGREYVRKLNEKRIFVDLAHISPEGFWDAVEIHDRAQPLIVTHTGVKGVHDHWRNLDDRQIKAVADSGGVVGVMYQSSFLGPSIFRGKIDWIVDHLDHIIAVAGEDHAALGSDWDGTIIPPVEMRCSTEFPRLVQRMLDRGWSPERIRKVLGTNFLRSLELLRPSA
ncbi:MAG: membrane dipeptidase, partial [Myxococcales bacterium]|nr:membrane dipeptidase [Myxococcales bacterium]